VLADTHRSELETENYGDYYLLSPPSLCEIRGGIYKHSLIIIVVQVWGLVWTDDDEHVVVELITGDKLNDCFEN
jgi:hypothetical protein